MTGRAPGRTVPQPPMAALFPGIDGVPFRSTDGHVPDLKPGDPASRRPVQVWDVRVRIFDLSKVGDLAEYEAICQRISRKQATLSTEDRQWVPEKRTWFVLVRWGEPFLEMQKGDSREQSSVVRIT